MTMDAQAETIAFLQADGRGRAAEIVKTHISMVFLTADRAFKLKRAVRFPYLDFSTAERRLIACEAELALNRRTAPNLYLGVRRITRDPGGTLSLDGPGLLVDAVVEMRRFDQDDLLDRLALRGALTPRIATALAQRLAAFHDGAAVSTRHGGAAGMRAVLAMNDASLRATSLVAADAALAIAETFRQALAHRAELLDRRRAAGKVRRCHGDLILRNICLLDGEPTLFDCIEFDETIATIDVLYDLAFLLMDLWRRDQRDIANLILNRYLDARDETDGVALLPFFMAVRACIRAHVTAAQAADLPPETAAPLLRDAHGYLDLARSLLVVRQPVMLAIGGLSGSGKSTLAAAVAPHCGFPPGARILSSDRIRKGLHGVPAEERLPAAAYRPEKSARVYATMRSQAAATLATGWSVVVDAVFDRPADRAAIEAVAAQRSVRFAGIWLEVPPPTLLARIAGRVHDASDATADVLQRQLARDPGEIAWRRLDACDKPEATRGMVLADIAAWCGGSDRF